MRILKWKRVVGVLLAGLSLYGGGAVRAFADHDGKDSPPAKPATTNIEAPGPLTARERLLLDRVEQLEKRVADLESKGTANSTPAAADVVAAQPASTNPAASAAGPVSTAGTTSGSTSTTTPAAP